MTRRIVLLSLILALASCQSLGGKKRLRFGSNHSEPFNYWDDQGHAIGFAVEVINRAAELEGFEVEWIRASAPEKSFNEGVADLWPFVTFHEERRSSMYLTRDWWRMGTILYFPESLKLNQFSDLDGKRLALTSPQRRFILGAASKSNASIEVFDNPRTAFEAMCTGKADAVLMDYRVAEGVMLNRPATCPPMRLGTMLPDEASRLFSIGAKFGFEREANRLRDRIDLMAESGEMIDIAIRWKLLHRTDSAFILWLNLAREKNKLLQNLFWGSVILLVIVLIFAQRLATARRMAELSARSRSQFLANMSHEIRTPMNGILGMTELTLETDLTSEQRENLSMARNSAKGLLEILDDILDFSRIESGKLTIESIPFDIAETAKRSVQILRLAAEAKHLSLEFEVQPGLPRWVSGDPGRIQQVLINLLGNAVKFTEKGSVRLEVASTPNVAGLYNIQFTVSDTGIGIAPEKQKQIFDAFTQADPTTTRKFGGTGLGLAISSELVRMMGGKLTVDSIPNSGSRFQFTLPLTVAQPGHQPVEPAPQSSSRALKILVAEDNDVNRTLIQKVLANGGHNVQSVPNGLLALEALSQNTFDAVLMDVHMPEMDGLEATRRWRELEATSGRHTPIIALTALAIKGDAEKCLGAGMDAYLPKPLNKADLFALLSQVAVGQKLNPLPHSIL